jgi:isocitrate/isopropylmalate dehydrogenase
MKLSDGLFLDCFYTVAKEFPDIEADDKIIDNACMQLVMRPEQFDVLVLENLYGDIVSDLCAGLIGGLGLAPGANIGEQGAVFEAVHGSAPDIAGQGIANPSALLMSAIVMLRHIGERDAAQAIEDAMLAVFAEGKVRTRDLGGTATTTEFAGAIIAKLGKS